MPSLPSTGRKTARTACYRMGDVTKATTKPSTTVKKGSADASVSVPAVTAPGTTFSGRQNHANKAAIDAWPPRGIINGMGQGTFMPNKTMTRAEFAAIVTRALGLAAKGYESLTDVTPAPNGTPVTSHSQQQRHCQRRWQRQLVIRLAPSPGRSPPQWWQTPRSFAV